MFSPVMLSSLGTSSFSSKSSADDQSIRAKTDQAPSILSSSIATFAFGFLDEEPAAAPDEYGGGLFALVDDELDSSSLMDFCQSCPSKMICFYLQLQDSDIHLICGPFYHNANM